MNCKLSEVCSLINDKMLRINGYEGEIIEQKKKKLKKVDKKHKK